jgi:hypothetical protein
MVKRIQFINDGMMCIILRQHLFSAVLNVHAPTEDISDMKDIFYKEL